MRSTELIVNPLPKTKRTISVALLLLLGLTGCCHWTDQSGTSHVLIIGIGMVSVNDSKPAAATVTRIRALGVTAAHGGVTAGYSSQFVTAIPAGAEDVRIEASQRPYSPIRVEVQKAQLKQTSQNQKE